MPAERLALFTTVYRGVEPYLRAWYNSVRSQTDRDFDLWIATDQLPAEAVADAIGMMPAAEWWRARTGDSPARLRTVALERLTATYPAVVFVDADDVLHPTRIAAARAELARFDVTGCALEIIDGDGKPVGQVFGPPAGTNVAELLPRHNVFGLSNSAYRSTLLRRCLPVPDDCALIDWLLVTRAWALGASLGFDPTPRMSYRQYGANVARVVPPFASRYVLEATARVLSHYRTVLDSAWALPPAQRQALEGARAKVGAFHAAVTTSAATLARYVEALNRLTPKYVWWWCVAHAELEGVWSD